MNQNVNGLREVLLETERFLCGKLDPEEREELEIDRENLLSMLHRAEATLLEASWK